MRHEIKKEICPEKFFRHLLEGRLFAPFDKSSASVALSRHVTDHKDDRTFPVLHWRCVSVLHRRWTSPIL